ncbi:hypothetical protein [Kocuria rosea]|uniref:hypothetical protein n=1 Tax=Kocuria rosea TaxID=1275 RepID=UPI000ABEDE88|nr:hypothetical protein [Kocuria polaris]
MLFDFTGLQALAFILPVLGYPVLVIVGLLVETPILRREPATHQRRTAAVSLAVISLLAAASLLVMGPALGAFAVLLLGGLVIPAVRILVRLRRLPPATTTS